MLQLTIKEALTDPDYSAYLRMSTQDKIQALLSLPPDEPYRIYQISEEETIFYIGQSSCPHNRLRSHLGMDTRRNTSAIGRFILQHSPRSDTWLFTQYTLAECAHILAPGVTCDIDTIENALIQRHRPPFNIRNNPTPHMLPAKYDECDENPYSEKLTARFGFSALSRR